MLQDRSIETLDRPHSQSHLYLLKKNWTCRNQPYLHLQRRQKTRYDVLKAHICTFVIKEMRIFAYAADLDAVLICAVPPVIGDISDAFSSFRMETVLRGEGQTQASIDRCRRRCSQRGSRRRGKGPQTLRGIWCRVRRDGRVWGALRLAMSTLNNTLGSCGRMGAIRLAANDDGGGRRRRWNERVLLL